MSSPTSSLAFSSASPSTIANTTLAVPTVENVINASAPTVGHFIELTADHYVTWRRQKTPDKDLLRSDQMVFYSAVMAIVFGTVFVIIMINAISGCIRILMNAKANYELVTTTNSSATDPVEVIIPPNFPIIPDSRLKFVTMDMAQEKPLRFSPQQLESFTKNYLVVLGSGGYGIVYKGELPKGEQIAVKVLNNSSNKKVEEQFMAEVSTLGRTYHINLVRLYGFCFDPNMRALVYEYMENNSLDQVLFNKTRTMEWEKLQKIAVGTAKGIAYLHEECEKKIIHYDIKPGNVLLDEAFNPKVADFGLAKLCNRESTHVTMTGYRGTPGYAAPELWKPYPVTHKCDVYSFGMLLFEVVGRRRNHNANSSETREWLPRWCWETYNNGQLGDIMELCGIKQKDQEEASRVLMVAFWCVQYLPEARPLMSTVVKMLGGENVSPPPNPFQYMESSSLKRSPVKATNTASCSKTSYSVPMKRMFEVQSKITSLSEGLLQGLPHEAVNSAQRNPFHAISLGF